MYKSLIYTSDQIAPLTSNITSIIFQLKHSGTLSEQTTISLITTNIVITVIVSILIRVAVCISSFKFTLTIKGTAQTLVSTYNDTIEQDNNMSKLCNSSISSQNVPLINSINEISQLEHVPNCPYPYSVVKTHGNNNFYNATMHTHKGVAPHLQQFPRKRNN